MKIEFKALPEIPHLEANKNPLRFVLPEDEWSGLREVAKKTSILRPTDWRAWGLGTYRWKYSVGKNAERINFSYKPTLYNNYPKGMDPAYQETSKAISLH